MPADADSRCPSRQRRSTAYTSCRYRRAGSCGQPCRRRDTVPRALGGPEQIQFRDRTREVFLGLPVEFVRSSPFRPGLAMLARRRFGFAGEHHQRNRRSSNHSTSSSSVRSSNQSSGRYRRHAGKPGTRARNRSANPLRRPAVKIKHHRLVVGELGADVLGQATQQALASCPASVCSPASLPVLGQPVFLRDRHPGRRARRRGSLVLRPGALPHRRPGRREGASEAVEFDIGDGVFRAWLSLGCWIGCRTGSDRPGGGFQPFLRCSATTLVKMPPRT